MAFFEHLPEAWRAAGMKRALFGGAVLCLAPAIARAATPLMELQPYLAPAPTYLFYAAIVGAACCGVAALINLWRVLRGPRRPRQRTRGQAAWRLVGCLAWGAAPFAVLSLLAERERLLSILPSLAIGVAWTVLLLPALTAGAAGRRARWLRLSNLFLADLAAGILLALYFQHTKREVFFAPLIVFTLALHLALLTGWTARGVRQRRLRWLLLSLLLLFSADFFHPESYPLDRRPLAADPVRQIGRLAGPVRQALLDREGQTAFVLMRRGDRAFYQVRLSDGAILNKTATTAPIAALAMDPSRRTLALAYDGNSAKRLELFDAISLVPQGHFQGGDDFTAQALVVGEHYVALGGEGQKNNLLLCPIQDPEPGYLDACKEIATPLARIGALAMAEGRFVFAAEGERWLADGWEIQAVSLTDGELLHRLALGRSVGEMAYDPAGYRLYVARPDLGQVEICAAERKLIPVMLMPAAKQREPGWRFPQLDGSRHLLLGASRRTGYLAVYDLKTQRMKARAAIGSGISSLDYDPARGVALVAAERGLVRVNVLELPGMKGR